MSVDLTKPWYYSVAGETCIGWCGNDLWFTSRSTGGDASDSLQVSMPTDPQSLDLIEQWVRTMRAR
jgi:hypothetical protein